MAVAAASPVALRTPPQEGFTSLFDGKSLRGWNVEEGPDSAFYVSEGALVSSKSSQHPAWLRSDDQFENFDLRLEFFVEGWIDGGLLFHAPRHGRPTWVGKQVKIFHQSDEEPKPNSMGAIFPLVAPSRITVKSGGTWNSMRVLMDWPRLQVWVNDVVVQDLDLESNPELRYRLRSGYLGLSGLGYPIRFRNLIIRELPSREQWTKLYSQESDLEKWRVSESSEYSPVTFQGLGPVIRAEGAGHLATLEKYRDFEMTLYVRGPKEHNGGVLVRSEGKGLSGKRHYEIQIHNVADAHYATGSLYYFKRAAYPQIEDERWYPMQIRMQERRCFVRVNGDTVLEYDQLENLEDGHIELQAHQPGSWLEFKDIRVKRL
jgi:hypothetical protein